MNRLPTVVLGIVASLAIVTGCSGNGGSSSGSPLPATANVATTARTPALTTAFVQSLHRATLAGIPAGVHVDVPSLPSTDVQTQSGRRSIRSTVGANDAEVVGTVINGGGGYTGLQVDHAAYPAYYFSLLYPPGSTGSQELFAPLTLPPNGGCLSPATVALNTGGPSLNYTFFVVFDYCGNGAPRLVAGTQIDDPRDTSHAFVNNYIFRSGILPVYRTLTFTTDAVPSQTSVWYLLLYNNATSNWDLVYQETGLTQTTYGYAVYESVYLPGQCPTGLPPVGVLNMQLFTPPDRYEQVSPQMLNTTSVIINPNPTTSCFTATGSNSPTQAFAPNNLPTTSEWTVTSVQSPIAVDGHPGSTSVTFTPAGQPQTFYATEGGYSGKFTATSANTAVATVPPGTGTAFTITPLASGTTTITILDAVGNSAFIYVTVKTGGGGKK